MVKFYTDDYGNLLIGQGTSYFGMQLAHQT